MLQAPLQLRELVISNCRVFQRFPSSIGRLKQLRKIVVNGAQCLRSLPKEFCLLQSLEHLEINGCEELLSLPKSMGNLRNLRHLNLYSCTQLGRLPESINQLINLESLEISVCKSVSEFDVGGGSSNSLLFKLKTIYLSHNSNLVKISMPKECCPSLETLTIYGNSSLREMEGLPSSVRKLVISGSPNLCALPKFSQLISRSDFNCRELEVPCVESVECMERLRTVQITAMRKSVDEARIRSLKKYPGEIKVCMRAVENAASIVNSFAFPTLSLVDSCSDVEIIGSYRGPELVVREKPSNGDAIIVCFVVSTPCWALLRIGSEGELQAGFRTNLLHLQSVANGEGAEVERGKWVWIGVFTQRSQWYSQKRLALSLDLMTCLRSVERSIVEKAFIATVEEERAIQALQCILELMGM